MNLPAKVPSKFKLSPEQRAASWLANPPRPMPLFQDKPRDEDATTQAFRAEEEEHRRQKSLAKIGKMKAKLSAPKIDYKNMRWNGRKGRWEPMFKSKTRSEGVVSGRMTVAEPNFKEMPKSHHIDKFNAERLARLNGVWDDKYAKLSGGLLVMTINNRIKTLVKQGLEIK